MKKLMLLLLAVFLFSGVTAAQDTLYSETVLNGNLENTWYPEWNGNNMEVEFMSGNPSGDSWVCKLGNDSSGGGVGGAFSGDPTWTDFRLEAQVYVPVDPSTAATYYGIEFRMDSVGLGGSAYQFLARFKQGLSDQGLRFRSRVAGSPTTIKQWLAVDIPGGIPSADGWHHLAVEVEGNQFRFFFNGNELPGGPYIDDTFGSGWIGTYIWDMAVIPAYLFIDDIYVINTTTGIQDTRSGIISGYDLYQNFPNPFNPSTTINFDLPVTELVKLNIYNNLGQKVRSLTNREFTAGTHQVQWDGHNEFSQEAPAGVYYYQIQAGSFQATNKMLLIK
jgi:hypothetical protein